MSDLQREGERDCSWATLRRREARKAANTYELPACQSWSRRKRLEKDLIKWLLYYGEDDPFVKEWGLTEQQREMALAIHDAALKGGDPAFARLGGERPTDRL